MDSIFPALFFLSVAFIATLHILNMMLEALCYRLFGKDNGDLAHIAFLISPFLLLI